MRNIRTHQHGSGAGRLVETWSMYWQTGTRSVQAGNSLSPHPPPDSCKPGTYCSQRAKTKPELWMKLPGSCSSPSSRCSSYTPRSPYPPHPKSSLIVSRLPHTFSSSSPPPNSERAPISKSQSKGRSETKTKRTHTQIPPYLYQFPTTNHHLTRPPPTHNRLRFNETIPCHAKTLRLQWT